MSESEWPEFFNIGEVSSNLVKWVFFSESATGGRGTTGSSPSSLHVSKLDR